MLYDLNENFSAADEVKGNLAIYSRLVRKFLCGDYNRKETFRSEENAAVEVF